MVLISNVPNDNVGLIMVVTSQANGLNIFLVPGGIFCNTRCNVVTVLMARTTNLHTTYPRGPGLDLPAMKDSLQLWAVPLSASSIVGLIAP